MQEAERLATTFEEKHDALICKLELESYGILLKEAERHLLREKEQKRIPEHICHTDDMGDKPFAVGRICVVCGKPFIIGRL